MLEKSLLLFSLVFTCNAGHAADCYRNGDDMKPYLHKIVLKIASMNLGCKVDQDCTYEENGGGFIVAKDKLYIVKDCFQMVSDSMCRASINPKTGLGFYSMEKPFKELDMPTFLSPPNQAKCIDHECKSSELGKKMNWKSMWGAIDGKFRAPGPVCWEYVKNPMKDYKNFK